MIATIILASVTAVAASIALFCLTFFAFGALKD